MTSLFDPIRVGAIDCPNRIWMAPLTRGRGTREHVPTDLMVTYYTQRASAGLIISEATGISEEGSGWPYAPGLWSTEQATQWKKVTDSVHAAGGRIFAQLWHMGRVVHPSLHGVHPVSSSATVAPGKAHTYEGRQPYVEARPLALDEIPRLLGDYANAARQALAAGFDGVQLHAANGYLIDQFLRDGANKRTDAYGGPVENRVRLLREVVQTLIDVVGADRTAVRLSPNGDSQGVDDSDQDTLFPAAAVELSKLKIAFLELREPGPNGTFGKSDRPAVAPKIRKAFDGPLILNSDYDFDSGAKALASGVADAISYGRPFLANPDLPTRFAKGLPLNQDEMATWYSQGEKGYIDYPTASA
ncbi:2,4-dienoyl-CoA reductase-like NADH-dependent reductase (Old Yellow Enzyme family) [Panacagrimonas perspica]|uniref:2,4-dienoyl-CoA reductase-like NADH-dependent reductase (Old Yellow Enzyme family) n=1 Tax=Panacagrimonas perspica TaxID=381431 RepID=A0A4V3URJ0_9GAMM|nr:alkene reductase [Panacagrimonas perspica]TDU31769.1 2,4-dienoyl-CoA reductase-like NADH-dependent reductase (Old Yellow Enzyme family) [Panacagrimonas perspica]THD03021.1 alkene reductase [Panacagrimonas perspica]